MKDKVLIKIKCYYYDLSSSDRMKEEPCIGLVQDIYLTYSSLVVYICYNLSLKVLR